MLEIIQSKLKTKYPQLNTVFGSLENFFINLNQLDLLEEEKEIILYKLLSHSDDLVILSSTHLSFNLYDNFTQKIINLNKPYSVYDLEGNLYYQVSNHQGKFGYSPLDRLLILEASSLDFYYLSYEEENESSRLLLLVIYKPNIFEDYVKSYFPFLAENPIIETPIEIKPPSTPSGLSILSTSISHNQAEVQWNATFEPLLFWRIRYKSVSSSIWTTNDISYISNNNPSTKLNSLSSNTEYQVQLQSANSAGLSEWSSVITFKTCKENNDLLDLLPSTFSLPSFRISLIPNLLDISGNNISISSTGTIPIVKTQEKWGLFIQNGSLNLSIPLPSSYTKACWIYLNNLNESGDIFSSTTVGKDSLYLKDGTIITTNNSSVISNKGYTPPSNEWIFICTTYNSSTQKLRLYINGNLTVTDSALSVTGSSIQRIGKSPAGNGINGFIGNDVLLFNYSLSANNIQELYQFQLNSQC